jgi:hypothetical protein
LKLDLNRLARKGYIEPRHSQELKQVSTLPFADSDQQPVGLAVLQLPLA